MKFAVWDVVRPASPDHPRAGQVADVTKVNYQRHPDEVVVRWNVDGTEESVPMVDLAPNV